MQSIQLKIIDNINKEENGKTNITTTQTNTHNMSAKKIPHYIYKYITIL